MGRFRVQGGENEPTEGRPRERDDEYGAAVDGTAASVAAIAIVELGAGTPNAIGGRTSEANAYVISRALAYLAARHEEEQ